MKPIVFVGQSPSQSTQNASPFTGAAGDILASWLKMSKGEMLEKFEFTNVLSYWPGKAVAGKGDRFPFKDARAAAMAMLPTLQGRCVVFVGRAVASAFMLTGYMYFQWYDVASKDGKTSLTYMVIPHTSGVNRWWNDPRNRQVAELGFMRILELQRRLEGLKEAGLLKD